MVLWPWMHARCIRWWWKIDDSHNGWTNRECAKRYREREREGAQWCRHVCMVFEREHINRKFVWNMHWHMPHTVFHSLVLFSFFLYFSPRFFSLFFAKMHTDEEDQNATTATFHFLGSLFLSFFHSQVNFYFANAFGTVSRCTLNIVVVVVMHGPLMIFYLAWFIFRHRLASTFDSIRFRSVLCMFSTLSVWFVSIQFAIVRHYRFTRFCLTLLRQRVWFSKYATYA